jgi:thiamine transport system permease protein
VWLIPTAFLAAFLLWPITQLATTVQFSELASLSVWRVAALAFGQAMLSVAGSLLVGIPIASVVSRYRGTRWTLALVTVPFVMPTVVVALAFRSLFPFDNGLLLVVLAHIYLNIAVVVRVVGATWAQLDQRIDIAAESLGVPPWQRWRTVTLPMLRPAVLASAGIVFIFTFTSLGIVLILGDATTRTLELQVLRQTSVLLDFSGATASALVQLLLVAIVVGWLVRMNRKLPPRLPRDQALRPLPATQIGKVRVIGTLIVTNIIVLVPIAALVIASLRSSGGWTLTWWQSLTSIDAGTTRVGSPLSALGLSLTLAIITGVVAALIGGLAAMTVLGAKTARLIAIIAILPLGISAATLGLGTLLAFGRPPLDLRATGLLIPIAHALIAVPLVVAIVAPALRANDRRLVDVASSLGAAPTRAFFTAYGPVLRIVMLAAGGLALAVSLGEFGAASFLGRAGTPTVPVQIARLLSRPGEQSFGVAAVLAVILVIMTMALILTMDRMAKRVRT